MNLPTTAEERDAIAELQQVRAQCSSEDEFILRMAKALIKLNTEHADKCAMIANITSTVARLQVDLTILGEAP